MKRRAWMLVPMTLAMAAAPAVAQLSSTTLWVRPVAHDCAFPPDDTVRVELMMNAISHVIDSGSFNVTFDPAKLGFVRGERGALISNFATFTATDGAVHVSVTIGNATPMPTNVSGHLATLVFVAACTSPTTEALPLCLTGKAGDFVPVATQCGNVTVFPVVPGSLHVESVYRRCFSALNDTIEVDVVVDSPPQPIDAAGFDVPFDFTNIRYVGYRRGNLTTDWPFFGVAVPLGTTIVRVGGFSSTPIPAGTSGVFVTLRFVVKMNAGTTTLCTQDMVDDFEGYSSLCGQVQCQSLATRPVTWGEVKSLYR